MDLLIQRVGRLHRHAGRVRPLLLKEPVCYITGIENTGDTGGTVRFHRGSQHIYGAYLLMNTQALLPERIVLPDDISRLVQAAYDKDGVMVAKDAQDDYREAKAEHEELIRKAAHKAAAFQIGKPTTETRRSTSTIVGWLDTEISNDPSGKRAEATVRDTADSIQVLVIREGHNGELRTLPWLDGEFKDCLLPEDLAGNGRLAQAVASSAVSLPANMCAPWIIDKVITALEKDCCEKLPFAWQQSPWLQGELFLILDKNLCAGILDFKLHYEEKYGLCVRKDGGT
jgi:hypothetical protein